MNKDETTQEESIDQPTEESTPDQLQEESQDQPSAEVEEDSPESEEQEEFEEEDSEDEEVITIDGETYTPEQAKELLSKGKHYTYEMQQFREEQRQFYAQQARQPNQPMSDEEKEVAEAQKTLRKYGVVTEDQVDAKLRDFQMKQSKQLHLQAFKDAHPEVNEFALRMIEGAADAWDLSYEQAYQRGWGGGSSPKKVVKKKTVGASKRATTEVSGRGGAELTRADIEEMSPEEYKKREGEIDQLIREGKLK